MTTNAKKPVDLDKLLGRVNALFFEPAQGRYFASPGKLPAGITVRVPASGDTPSAEALLLLTGVSVDQTAIRNALASGIGEGATPPGDVLLALALK